jgi:hypothetical protein
MSTQVNASRYETESVIPFAAKKALTPFACFKFQNALLSGV